MTTDDGAQSIENQTIFHIIIEQIAFKSMCSNSWFVVSQILLRKYNLSAMLEIVALNLSEEAWKTMVKKAISTHWKKIIEEEANTKSTLSHMNATFTYGQPHLEARKSQS